MKCPYCFRSARWVENKEVYGKNLGRSYMMWLCSWCDAYVGCHNNTRKPLGTMANKELRRWRMKAHAAFDPIWKSGKTSRREAYRWLANQLAVAVVHIGESDVIRCKEIVIICNGLS